MSTFLRKQWAARIAASEGRPRVRVLLNDGTQPEIVQALEKPDGSIVFVDTLGKHHPADTVISYREIKAASRENSTPTRVKARDWINNALRDGRIEKPPHCQGRDCKATDIKAHHFDYRTKDKVKWYCSDCHEKADSKHGALEGERCPRCNGVGFVYYEDEPPPDDIAQCPECKGSGVEKESAKKPEWVKLTKSVRCRLLKDQGFVGDRSTGPAIGQVNYGVEFDVKAGTVGEVLGWLQGETIPTMKQNGEAWERVKSKITDHFVVRFPDTPGPVSLGEDQIELLDPIPRRKTAVSWKQSLERWVPVTTDKGLAINVQIKQRYDPDEDYLGGTAIAYVGDREVAYMPYGENQGQITIGDMEVVHSYQRRGIGTALMEVVRNLGVPLEHYPDEGDMSPAGRAFKRSIAVFTPASVMVHWWDAKGGGGFSNLCQDHYPVVAAEKKREGFEVDLIPHMMGTDTACRMCRDMDKTGAVATVGWHMSKTRNRESILATGLEAGRSLKGKNYRVYVDTQRPAKLQPRSDSKPSDLWEVDLTGIPYRADPELPDRWIIVEQDIPPGRLKLVDTTHGTIGGKVAVQHKLIYEGTGRDLWGQCSCGRFVWLGTYHSDRGRRETLRAEFQRHLDREESGQQAKQAGRYVFDVTYAYDKDTLMTGEINAGTHRVTVVADDIIDAQLMAEQMVAATGLEPTDTLAISWPEEVR